MARRIWLNIAVFLLCLPSLSGAQTCAGRCTCWTTGIAGQGNYTKVVDCSDRALPSVPNAIPSDTTELNLRNNTISWLDTNVFRKLPWLHKVDLSINQLKTLPNDVFNYNPSLHEVDLSANPLTCDCKLYGTHNLSQHLANFTGTCVEPVALAHRQVRSLKMYEFCGGCMGLKTTGKGSRDGEYVIRLNAKCEDFARVYCHGMSTNSPQEYISLLSGSLNNYARIYDYKQPEAARNECEKAVGGSIYKESGLTNFTKVRLILSASGATIKADDFQFASKIGRSIALGVAGDCYSASPENCRKGRFRIDLTGTDFRLKDNVHWENYGSPSYIHNTLEIDAERRLVYGECGGYCGGCRPRGKIELELNACPEEGVKPCFSALGMDDRSISDSQITSSSSQPNYLPSYGRLNNIKSANMGGAWCAAVSDANQWLQIDMGKKTTLSGIATQGASDAQNWLTKFKIQKSNDGTLFKEHTEFAIAKEFSANQDNFNVVTNWFSQRFRARFVRIVPLQWNNAICLRAELYGCDNDIVSVVVRYKADKRCWSPLGSNPCSSHDGTHVVLNSYCQGDGVMMTFRKDNSIRHTCSDKCVFIDGNNLLTLRTGPCDIFIKQAKGDGSFLIVHKNTKYCVKIGDVKKGTLAIAPCSNQPTLFEFSQDGIAPLRPIITVKKTNYLRVGMPGWVHCKVIADSRAQIFWSRNLPWPGGQRLSKIEFLQSLNGSLYIRKARTSYSGRYFCSAANTADYVFGSLDIKVGSPPNITVGPADTEAVVNKTALMNCEVAASNLPTQVSWYRRRIQDGLAPVSTDKLSQRFLVLTNMSLRINHVLKSDEAYYECVAKNPLGTRNATAFLKVLVPPSFYIFPKDIEVPSSSSRITNCKGIGDPAPVIRWSRKGSSAFPKNFKVYANGSLFMRDIAKADQGTYVCSALNQVGTAKAEAKVKVYVACRIDSVPHGTHQPYRIFFRVGESAVVACNRGFQLREGAVQMNITCQADGHFDNPMPKCKDIDECRVDPSTEQNNHNSTSRHDCHKNAQCTNTLGSHLCACSEGYNGNGYNCTPKCRRPKTPLHGTNWLPEKKFYDIGATITLVCLPGFAPNSMSSVTCKSLASFGPLPECRDIDECFSKDSPCHKEAVCTNTAGSHTCRCKAGHEGDGHNSCSVAKTRFVKSSSGKEWTYSPKMDTILEKMAEYKAKNTTAIAVLKAIGNKTAPQKGQFTSGDLLVVFKTVKTLFKSAKVSGSHEEKTEELKAVTKVCSDLLAEQNEDEWKDIQKDGKGVTEVMKLVEDYASTLAADLVVLRGNVSSVTLDTENIGLKLEVRQAKTLYDGHKYPESSTMSQVVIAGAVFEDYPSGLQTISITGVTYKSLGKMLPKRADGVKKFDVDSSAIVSTSLHPKPALHAGKLAAPVLIYISDEKVSQRNSIAMCVFWDFEKDADLGGSWSSEGCRVVSTGSNGTVCECDHMTSFASLAVHDKKLVLSLVVYVGCGLLILAAVILIVRHLYLRCKLKSERSVIHLNLCFAIAAGIGLFIGTLTLTKIKIVCLLIAALLHYFFVAMFCWIVVKCLQIYMTLATGKNKNSSRIKWFFIVGWLFPAIVVGISLGVFQMKGYGNSEWCWMDYSDMLLWAYVGPAAIFFLVTLVLVIMNGVVKSRVVDSLDKTKVSVALLLAVLLALAIAGTWTAAAIYVKHHQVMLWEYVFAGSCVLQAIILLLFGLLDKEIKNFSFIYQIKKIQQKEHKEKRNYYSTTDTVQYYGAANAPDGKDFTVTRPSAKESTSDLRGSSKRLSRIGSNQEVNGDSPDYPTPILDTPAPLDESYRRKIESYPLPYTPSHPNSEVIQLQTFPVRKRSPSPDIHRFSEPDGAEAPEPSASYGERRSNELYYSSLPRNADSLSSHSKLQQIPERQPLMGDYHDDGSVAGTTVSECSSRPDDRRPRGSDSEREPLDPSRRRTDRSRARLEERYKMDRDSINSRKRNLRFSSGFMIGATIEADKNTEKTYASL